MCNWKCPLLALSLGALALTVGLAQPEKKPADKPAAAQPGMPSDAEMAKMMALMQPGPEHKVLEGLLGEWEGDVKIWMAPDAPPSTSHGRAKREMALDGRFLIEHIDADPIMPMPGGPARFKGMGIFGYNAAEKKYESIWLDNVSTWMSTSTGKYDAAKKIFTFEGDMFDAAAGKKVHHRDIMDVSNPDRHTSVGYATGPDGNEFKCFEGVFERKKK